MVALLRCFSLGGTLLLSFPLVSIDVDRVILVVLVLEVPCLNSDFANRSADYLAPTSSTSTSDSDSDWESACTLALRAMTGIFE
jgi:hypothetical protein